MLRTAEWLPRFYPAIQMPRRKPPSRTAKHKQLRAARSSTQVQTFAILAQPVATLFSWKSMGRQDHRWNGTRQAGHLYRTPLFSYLSMHPRWTTVSQSLSWHFAPCSSSYWQIGHFLTCKSRRNAISSKYARGPSVKLRVCSCTLLGANHFSAVSLRSSSSTSFKVVGLLRKLYKLDSSRAPSCLHPHPHPQTEEKTHDVSENDHSAINAATAAALTCPRFPPSPSARTQSPYMLTML